MNTNTKEDFQPTQDEIASSAYQLWESSGRPCGCEMDHWLQAEAKLKAARKQSPSGQSAQSGQGSQRAQNTQPAQSTQASFSAPQRATTPAPGNSLRTPGGDGNGGSKANRPRKPQGTQTN